MDAFLNADHQLRSGWRFLAYVLFFLLIWVATGVLLSMVAGSLVVDDSMLVILGVNAIVMAVPAVTALVIMARTVDRVPVSVYGTVVHPGAARDLAGGFAVAGVMLIIVAGAGLAGESAIASSTDSATQIAATLLILTVSAANEELVFRGYPLQVLMKGLGPAPAVLLLSGLFGLLHYDNPNGTLLGALNTVLAGILLSAAYIRTRSLWLPYGIHLGWNAGLGPVLGLPLSGIDTASLWVLRSDGADWLTGGTYGPEGGVAVTAAFVIASIMIYRTRWFSVSRDVRARLENHRVAVYVEDKD